MSSFFDVNQVEYLTCKLVAFSINMVEYKIHSILTGWANIVIYILVARRTSTLSYGYFFVLLFSLVLMFVI